ncbi:MAG: lycopene cyclase domain-containing protein [Acidimicrobiales bacterium]
MGGAEVPAYTALALALTVVAVIVDVYVLRTRVLGRGSVWVSLAIMGFFQIFVDGWLTRARDTIVNYEPAHTSGVRVFFNTPVEDFGFGFGLIVLTLSVWAWLGTAGGAP